MEENVETPEPSEQAAASPAAIPEPDKDTKMWAMFCHLGGLATFLAIPFAGLIAPLVIWQIKKDDHPFIDANGKEVLTGGMKCLGSCFHHDLLWKDYFIIPIWLTPINLVEERGIRKHLVT